MATDIQIRTAEREGRMAFLKNLDAIANPFAAYSRDEEHIAWRRGWDIEADDMCTYQDELYDVRMHR